MRNKPEQSRYDMVCRHLPTVIMNVLFFADSKGTLL
jgi:hypothetical protein